MSVPGTGDWSALTHRQCSVQHYFDDLVRSLVANLRIAVVFGGDKAQPGSVIHEAVNYRSWKSYEAVARDIGNALLRLGCRNVRFLRDDLSLPGRLADEKIDLVWLNTGGVQGRSPMSHAAAMLELCGVPYIGHDPLTAALLDDKPKFVRMMQALGIPVARSMTWNPADGSIDPAAEALRAGLAQASPHGFIVKPASGRASLNVHFVETVENLRAVAMDVYQRTRGSVLIEAYLPGREYCIAVCGPTTACGERLSMGSRPFTFAAIERVLEPDEAIFTSMDSRPITADRVRLLDPVAERETFAALTAIAESLYRRLPLRTLVRLDVRADEAGRLHVLEANPKPDLKAPGRNVTSIVAEGLVRHGMSYDDLILALFADRIRQMMVGESEVLERLLESSVGRR